jgi:opacity protein-like surface antigen
MWLRYVYGLMAGLAAGLMAAQGSWAQPYIGLGVSNLALSSDYSSINGRSKTGFTLVGGYEFASTWFTELAVSSASGIDTGPTENIYYPADSAEYSILRVSIGTSFWTFAERRWKPWVAVGAAYHFVNWDTFYYQLDGTGLSLGAGVDVELVPSWRLRFQAIRYRFSAYDTYGDGPYSTRTTELSAAVIYAFR